MNKCPICIKTFEVDKLDKHIDLCLSETKSDENLIGVENNEISTEHLEFAMVDLKRAMKRVRDIVVNEKIAYHRRANPLYSQLSKDISKFLKGFNNFRKSNNLMESMEPNFELKESLGRKLSISDSDALQSKISTQSKSPNKNVVYARGSELLGKKHRKLDSEGEQKEILKSQRRANFAKTDLDRVKSNRLNACFVCKRLMIAEALVTNKACNHRICQFCVYEKVVRRVETKFYETNALHCVVPGCQKDLAFWQLSSFISKKVIADFSEQQMKFLAATGDLLSCPKCDSSFYKERSEANGLQSFEGVALTPEAQRDLAANRYRCSACGADFCAECKSLPYHKGQTCEQFAAFLSAAKCRFCNKEIPVNSGEEVCGSEECSARAAIACPQSLACGHKCIGTKAHTKCFGCIEKGCPENSAKVSGEDYCQICWIESIASAPSVELDCGHIFHFHCLEKKVQTRWPAARITFGYLSCPLCKVLLKCSKEPQFEKTLEKEREFYRQVRQKAFTRIEIEGFQSDEKLTDPASIFYNKPHEFALHRFAFYVCSKCDSIYFGGLRNCEEFNSEVSEDFERKHLVCGACSAGKDKKCCDTHGTAFLTFKCKFCCSVANWFCWGEVHFCDACHRSQLTGNMLTKKPISSLPKCRGKESCPLKIDHPANGIEFSLGCVVCLRK